MVTPEGLYSTPSQPFQAIDLALLDLWDKAKRAAEMITNLRESNEKLTEYVKSLEKSIKELQEKVTEKEKEIEEQKKHGSTMRALEAPEGVFILSPDEREALERKITDLLQRLNTHVS